MDDSEETRTDEEVLNRRFEYFKHMITVSTATGAGSLGARPPPMQRPVVS